MAHPDHLKVLQAGVRTWNEWITHQRSRSGAPGTRHPGAKVGVSGFWPDLRGADLSGRDLYQAVPGEYFGGIDLLGADLSGANLERATLAWAGLTGATLRGANLNGANLMNATLHGANVGEANLRGALLGGTDFLSANLAHADLSEAYLSETKFADTDLADVYGVETCKYAGPCTLDVRTLFNYQPLPLSLLRGCGVPDRLIEHLPSLRTDALGLYTCFISHSSDDLEFVKQLHADLQAAGVRCWFAQEDLKIGAKIWDAIDRAVHVHDKVVLVCSESSIRSDWVEDEVTKAFAEERVRKSVVLFPIRLDDSVMTTSEPWAVKLRDNRNIGDCRGWKNPEAYQASLKRILNDLRRG